jgi:hypothetical protein
MNAPLYVLCTFFVCIVYVVVTITSQATWRFAIRRASEHFRKEPVRASCLPNRTATPRHHQVLSDSTHRTDPNKTAPRTAMSLSQTRRPIHSPSIRSACWLLVVVRLPRQQLPNNHSAHPHGPDHRTQNTDNPKRQSPPHHQPWESQRK